MPIEIKIPEVGESITEAFINEWLKAEGDPVKKDEIIAELETDKVSFELPAPAAGTLTKVLKGKGESAEVGEVIGHMEEDGKAGGGKKAAANGADRERREVSEPAEEPSDSGPQHTAEVEVETGTEEDEVESKGREERRKAQPAPPAEPPRAPSPPPAAETDRDIPPISARLAAQAASDDEGREEELVRMSPIRQTIARRLVQAQQAAALLTTFNEVDLSAVNDLRRTYRDRFEQKYGVKLGFMSFFIKAAVDALQAFPAINAEVRDREILYRNYYDVGVAVSTDKGLVVPVLRDADRLSFAEIESAVNEFARRARDNDLDMKDIQGGTFTITNGGVFGSLLSTPIVNPPQSGVLGMHTIQDRPVARDGQVVIRPMMYLALTYDHRIVDGREAVTFLRRIKEAVEEPARILMEI